MSEPVHIHHSCSPGLTMEDVKVEDITNGMGQHYFKATSKIGSIFGAEVEVELSAIGLTREIALIRLQEEQRQLYESLWA